MTGVRQFFVSILVVAFIMMALPLPVAMSSVGPDPITGGSFYLPAPGVMVHLSPPYNPPMLTGIKVYPHHPFRFDFILNEGDSHGPVKHEAVELVKYFLASLTVPEKDLWVNLSPYEKNRIIPRAFGLTQMGRDLLAEDYILKQITASLIYPDGRIGRKFWKQVYQQAERKYGTTDISINTFNKVWIVPQKAVVYENSKAQTAYVVKARLKVMLDQDYLSLSKHISLQEEEIASSPKAARNTGSSLGSKILHEIIIPELNKEVNEDKNFVRLRQIYHSLILASWYKKKMRDSVLSEIYTDKNKVQGVGLRDPQEKQKIYQRYLSAFKKGVYNYIKEDIDPLTQQMVPRKYFSGGMDLDLAMSSAGRTNLALAGSPGLQITDNQTAVPNQGGGDTGNTVRVEVQLDRAMQAPGIMAQHARTVGTVALALKRDMIRRLDGFQFYTKTGEQYGFAWPGDWNDGQGRLIASKIAHGKAVEIGSFHFIVHFEHNQRTLMLDYVNIPTQDRELIRNFLLRAFEGADFNILRIPSGYATEMDSEFKEELSRVNNALEPHKLEVFIDAAMETAEIQADAETVFVKRIKEIPAMAEVSLKIVGEQVRSMVDSYQISVWFPQGAGTLNAELLLVGNEIQEMYLVPPKQGPASLSDHYKAVFRALILAANDFYKKLHPNDGNIAAFEIKNTFPGNELELFLQECFGHSVKLTYANHRYRADLGSRFWLMVEGGVGAIIRGLEKMWEQIVIGKLKFFGSGEPFRFVLRNQQYESANGTGTSVRLEVTQGEDASIGFIGFAIRLDDGKRRFILNASSIMRGHADALRYFLLKAFKNGQFDVLKTVNIPSWLAGEDWLDDSFRQELGKINDPQNPGRLSFEFGMAAPVEVLGGTVTHFPHAPVQHLARQLLNFVAAHPDKQSLIGRSVGNDNQESSAMITHAKATDGGIDMTSSPGSTEVRNSKAIQFNMDPAMLHHYEDLSGLAPSVIGIQPLADIRQFLGLDVSSQG